MREIHFKSQASVTPLVSLSLVAPAAFSLILSDTLHIFHLSPPSLVYEAILWYRPYILSSPREEHSLMTLEKWIMPNLKWLEKKGNHHLVLLHFTFAFRRNISIWIRRFLPFYQVQFTCNNKIQQERAKCPFSKGASLLCDSAQRLRKNFINYITKYKCTA